MDTTVQTIRKTITEAKSGITSIIVLVVNMTILTDIGWGHDKSTVRLIEYAARVLTVFVCCPHIPALEN